MPVMELNGMDEDKSVDSMDDGISDHPDGGGESKVDVTDLDSNAVPGEATGDSCAIDAVLDT